MTTLKKSLALGISLAVGLLIIALAAGANFRPISDPDFFWHLKAGGWIWEHKSLPHEFLFSATAPPTMTTAQRFGMTSYWVVQVIYHLLFSAGGMGAIVAFKLLLMALFIVALLARKEGDSFIYLGLLVMAVILMGLYSFERPQIVSFIFFALLLHQLERFRRPPPDRAPLFICLSIPLLMLVWANSHGAFIIGQGVIILYLAAETVKFTHPLLDPMPRERYRFLFAAGTAGLLASLINPNTYHVLEVAWLPRYATETIMEYKSTIAYYKMSANPMMLVYWFLLLLAILGLAMTWKKPDVTRLALVAGTACFSFFQIRYIPFFLVAALPAISRSFSRDRLVRVARVFVLAPALVAGMFFLRGYLDAFRNVSHSADVNSYLFPVPAADFIKNANLTGNFYSHFAWGGYLLWRLAPSKVFIDGRNHDQDLYDAYTKILEGYRQPYYGVPYWKSIFKAYGIRYIVMPFYDQLNGGVYHLLDVVLADPDWTPVFVKSDSIIFVENTPENHEVISRHALPKDQFLQRLVDTCNSMIKASPRMVTPYVAKGDLLVMQFMFGEALEAYGQAVRLAPGDATARGRVSYLKQMQIR